VIKPNNGLDRQFAEISRGFTAGLYPLFPSLYLDRHLISKDQTTMHMSQTLRRITLTTLLIVTLSSTLAIPPAHAGSDDYPSNLKQATQDSKVDPWGFYNRECTSFVAWRLNSRNGFAFTNAMGGGRFGDAGNWGSNARRLGYTVNMSPAIGSIAWWGAGTISTLGHVAWVEAVNGDNVTIEEYNYNRGAYTERTIKRTSVSGYLECFR
jgi:surface antigen